MNPTDVDALSVAPKAGGICGMPVAELGRRMGRGDFVDLVEAVQHCGGCAAPVRLRRPGGSQASSSVILKACGSRKETLCPACSAVYAADARQLVTAGMAGGKGVEASIATHPMVFVTLTAPSFGLVHSMPSNCRPCTALNGAEHCEHGVARSCSMDHASDNPELGSPLCTDCYEYEPAVLWNALVTELWRRTVVYSLRMIGRFAGIGRDRLNREVRLSYAKVIEYQLRGSVHVHAVVRGDSRGRDGSVTTPPGWLDTTTLAWAIEAASHQVMVQWPPGYRCRYRTRAARWGSQLDTRSIAFHEKSESGDVEDTLSSIVPARSVALYLSKYVTKVVDQSGALDHRIASECHLEKLSLDPHLRRMVETAWELGGREELSHLGLRRWANTLGFRGHVLTKSQRFSTTFKALREARHEWRKESEDSNSQPGAESSPALEYAGKGWGNRAEAWLAAAHREERQRQRRAYWDEVTGVDGPIPQPNEQ